MAETQGPVLDDEVHRRLGPPLRGGRGSAGRGLVAIDPATCWGDPAFDTVALLMWRANDLAALIARARELGDQLGIAHERPLHWCAPFAAMVALEEAEAAGRDHLSSIRSAMLVDLARSTRPTGRVPVACGRIGA